MSVISDTSVIKDKSVVTNKYRYPTFICPHAIYKYLGNKFSAISQLSQIQVIYLEKLVILISRPYLSAISLLIGDASQDMEIDQSGVSLCDIDLSLYLQPLYRYPAEDSFLL